ncbi:hypothetical protein SCUP515_01577 [Seiridium cupressi]
MNVLRSTSVSSLRRRSHLKTGLIPARLPLFSLYAIIKNYKKRRFCELLFDAIALHDPFEHPAIKEHLPPDFQNTTFERWATRQKTLPEDLEELKDRLKGYSPFGNSRNKIELEYNESDTDAPVQEKRVRTREFAEDGARTSLAAAGGAATALAIRDHGATAGIGSAATVANTAMGTDFKLPAVAYIQMDNINDPEAGLLRIKVYGYGNAPQPRLSVLSSFNFRIASSYQRYGRFLHFGNILKERVNVKGDCLRWQSIFDLLTWMIQETTRSYRSHRRGRCRNMLSSPIPGGTDDTRCVRGGYTAGDPISLGRQPLCHQEHPDNDNKSARDEQLTQMDSIFGHAVVTIIAAAGQDSQAGLAGITSDRKPGQMAREVAPNVNVMFPIQYDDSYGNGDTRAWTLQEKLLSRRRLVFGENHVSFHCRHGILREDMPAIHAANGPPPIVNLSMPADNFELTVRKSWDETIVFRRSPFFDQYAKLLEQYTSREMANPNDILKAILGLLRVLEKMRSRSRTLREDDTEKKTDNQT